MKSKIKNSIFFLLSFIPLNIFCQSKIGQEVKNIEFSNILNYSTKSASLKDINSSKAVIIDFWATWCVPCIASLPHLEKLRDNFKNDIEVFTVTDDSEERIKKFLQKKKINLPIVLDKNHKISDIFPHKTIPHTILIDKKGIIKAITIADSINDNTIKNLLNESPINLVEKVDNLKFDASQPLSQNNNFIYQITVTPFQKGAPSMSNIVGDGEYKGRRIFCSNLGPRSLFEIAYQFPVYTRTVIESKNKEGLKWNENNLVCFDLIVPEEIVEKRFSIMKQQLDNLFDYKATVEKRQTKVKILKIADAKKLTSQKGDNDGKEKFASGGSGIEMENAEIKRIAEFLEGEFNIPVVDETNITGKYNVKLNWYNENRNEIYSELKKIGLELIDGNREIDLLIVSDK